MQSYTIISGIKEMYLDYYNNYLTQKKFQEDYSLTEEEANVIILAGRELTK